MRKELYRYSSAHILDVFDENGPNAFFWLNFLQGSALRACFVAVATNFRAAVRTSPHSLENPRKERQEKKHTHIYTSTYIRIHTHTHKQTSMTQNALEPGRNFAPASASRILITPIIFISTVFEAFRTFRLINDSVVHYPRMKKRRKMKCRGISWKFSDRFCQVSARRSEQIKTNILRKDIVDTAEYRRFRAFCCHWASSNGPFSTVST